MKHVLLTFAILLAGCGPNTSYSPSPEKTTTVIGTVTSVQEDSSFTVVGDDGRIVFIRQCVSEFSYWRGERVKLTIVGDLDGYGCPTIKEAVRIK